MPTKKQDDFVVGELIPAEKKPKKNTRAMGDAKYELSLDRKLIVTPDLIEKIKKHYSSGATLRMIAYGLGVHPDTLSKEILSNVNLSRALHEGRLEKVHNLASKTYELAMAGDRVLLMFLLKTIGRFSESWKSNEDGEDVPVPPVLTVGTTDPVEAMRAYERIMKET